MKYQINLTRILFELLKDKIPHFDGETFIFTFYFAFYIRSRAACCPCNKIYSFVKLFHVELIFACRCSLIPQYSIQSQAYRHCIAGIRHKSRHLFAAPDNMFGKIT